uniref:Uncharacterized protein n=1 Tax=Siphoviridae sp. ctuUw41 TaxID=2826503 RepID=A0A8S5MYP1_9CAUD|nr:MAG TPA: hypothetical protein [Siphoviridae sp. ctuUw41]
MVRSRVVQFYRKKHKIYVPKYRLLKKKLIGIEVKELLKVETTVDIS